MRVSVRAKGRSAQHAVADLPSGGDQNASRDAYVAAALRHVLDEIDPRVRKAVLVLDAGSSFTKRIVLPPVRPAHVERALLHEAREHIPFSLEEVVWDAELLDTNPPEALLAAARKEVVDGLARAVVANGLRIERVTTAPVALANAAASHAGNGPNPSVLVAGSGDSVDLVCYDGTRFLMRSLPAGSAVDVVDQQADQLAESLGYAAGSAHRLFTNDAALSVGTGALLAGPLNIDLSPERVRQQRIARRKAWPRVACLVLTISILGVWIGGLQAWARADERRSVRLAEQVQRLQQLEARMKPVEAEIRHSRAIVHSCVRAMERAAGWHTVFREIQSVLPEGMFLMGSESLEIERGVRGLRVEVLSYTDREPEGVDPVKALRDKLRGRSLFSAETRVSSRPSRGAFARVFTLDVVLEEGAL